MRPPPSLASDIRSMNFMEAFLATALVVFYISFIGPRSYFGVEASTVVWVPVLLLMLFQFAQKRLVYSITDIGVKRRVDTFPVHPEEQVHCGICGESVENGEHRRYAKQQVVFGVPIRTLDWGEHIYCEECTMPESESGSSSEVTNEHNHGLEHDKH